MVVPRPVLNIRTSIASVEDVADCMTYIEGMDEVACTNTLYEVVTPVADAQVNCWVVVAVCAAAAMVQ